MHKETPASHILANIIDQFLSNEKLRFGRTRLIEHKIDVGLVTYKATLIGSDTRETSRIASRTEPDDWVWGNQRESKFLADANPLPLITSNREATKPLLQIPLEQEFSDKAAFTVCGVMQPIQSVKLSTRSSLTDDMTKYFEPMFS